MYATIIIAEKDNAIGIEAERLEAIFQPFEQADNATSRKYGGTGLGLSISRQLAELLGGTLAATSVPGAGSCFELQIPLVEPSADERGTERSSSAQSPAELVAGARILLAEDHDDNRRLIARLLATLGLEVFSARNGREAVALFEQHQPSLVLMDIQMPEMDGIEAYKVLRQKGCETPIVALTANAMSHEIAHYLSLGFDGHLSKPIERNVFIPTIAKYYGGVISQEDAEAGFDSVKMSDLVQEFKSNLVLEQQDLVLHINNNDLEKLAKLSHRIAGAAQMFGFENLSKISLQLETVINNKHAASINEHTQELLNEIDQVLW